MHKNPDLQVPLHQQDQNVDLHSLPYQLDINFNELVHHQQQKSTQIKPQNPDSMGESSASGRQSIPKRQLAKEDDEELEEGELEQRQASKIPKLEEVLNDSQESDVLAFSLLYPIASKMGMPVNEYYSVFHEMMAVFHKHMTPYINLKSPKNVEETTLRILEELHHPQLDIYREHIRQTASMNGDELVNAVMAFDQARPSLYVKGILNVVTRPIRPTMEYGFLNIKESKYLLDIYNTLMNMGYRNPDSDPYLFTNEGSLVVSSNAENFIKQVSVHGQPLPLLVCAFFGICKKGEIQDKQRWKNHIVKFNQIKNNPPGTVYPLSQDIVTKWRPMAANNNWGGILEDFDCILRSSITKDELYDLVIKKS